MAIGKQALTQAAAKIPLAMSDWVTVKEAATLCQVSERTMWRRVKSGKVESRLWQIGGEDVRLILLASLAHATDKKEGETSDNSSVAETDATDTDTSEGNPAKDVQALAVVTRQMGASIYAAQQKELAPIRQSLADLSGLPTAMTRQEELLQTLCQTVNRQEEELRALRAELAVQQKRHPWWMFWK